MLQTESLFTFTATVARDLNTFALYKMNTTFMHIILKLLIIVAHIHKLSQSPSQSVWLQLAYIIQGVHTRLGKRTLHVQHVLSHSMTETKVTT